VSELEVFAMLGQALGIIVGTIAGSFIGAAIGVWQARRSDPLSRGNGNRTPASMRAARKRRDAERQAADKAAP